MNLILFSRQEMTNSQSLILNDHRYTHIKQVLRSKPGNTLNIGEINGLMGQGTVENITDTEVHLTCQLSTPPPRALPLTIVLALPRPKMLRRMLKNIAELGIKRIAIIHSQKVEKSYWQSPLLQPQHIQNYFLEGLCQGKDTQLPVVTVHKQFRPFVEDILPTLSQGKDMFIAHPYQSQSMPKPSDQERLVIIGPEGGFNDFEVNLIKQQGAQPIHMGSRIYRVENALTLLSAYLSFTP